MSPTCGKSKPTWKYVGDNVVKLHTETISNVGYIYIFGDVEILSVTSENHLILHDHLCLSEQMFP
jgi:hypothetical protein